MIEGKQALNIQQLVSTTGTNLRSHSITTFNRYDRRIRGMWNVLEKLTIATPKELIDCHNVACRGIAGFGGQGVHVCMAAWPAYDTIRTRAGGHMHP